MLIQIFTFLSGISNIVSKLVTGKFSDMKCVDSFMVSNIYVLMSGVSVSLLTFCTLYQHFVVMIAFCGFFMTFFMLRSIVLVELVGLENLTSAYSLISLFDGIGSIIGAPISGFIGDSVGSFDVTFYIASGFFILSSLFGFAAQILHRLERSSINSQ